MAFDIEAARKDGVPDSAIADYLAKQKGFNIEAARKDGVPDDAIVNHLISKPAQPKAEETSKPTAPVQEQPTPAEDNSSDFVRGFKSYLPQTQEIIGGGEAILGKALGSESLKKSGLEGLQKAQTAQQQLSKDTDSFGNAWSKGIGSVVTDWLPYQAGIGAANMLETLAAMGVGAVAGAVTGEGVGAIPGAIAGGLEKQLVKKGIKEAAEKIAAKEGEEAAKLYVEAQAKKTAVELAESGLARQGAKAYGANVGIGAAAATHGLGEVGSRAVEEAQSRGESLDDVNLYKVLPAATVHAMTDYVADKIGLGALGDTLSGAGKNVLMDIVKNVAITGTKEVPPEIVQTALERFGADLPLADKQAFQEYIDTVAASYAMSAAPGVIGGVRSNLANKQVQTQPEDTTQTPSPAPTTAPATQAAQTSTTGVTSKDDNINKLLEGTENVGPDGTPISPSIEVVKPGRGKPRVKSPEGAGTTDTTGVDGTGAAVLSTSTGTQGEQVALNEVEQNLATKMQETGTNFNAPAHVKNWVKKNIFKGDAAATNQLEQNNPGIFKRLLDNHKTQTTAAPSTFNESELQDEQHLSDLEETQNVIEEVKKKEPKSKKVAKAQEILADATETTEPAMKQAKVRKAKEKAGVVEEKPAEEAASANPKAQEVLSKIVNDPNMPAYKKTLAQMFLHPYLLSKGEDAARAPKDVDEAIATAAAEDATDELSLIDIAKRDKALEDEAKQSNESRKTEYDAKVAELVTQGLTKRQANLQLGSFKKQTQTKTDVISLKKPEEFHDFSKGFVDEEEAAAQQEPAKKADIELRQSFISSLTPEQKTKFDNLKKNFIRQDHTLRANRTRAENTKTRVTKVRTAEQLAEQERLRDEADFNKRVAAVRKHIAGRKQSRKELAQQAIEQEKIKNEPIAAQNRLATALQEAIKAGKSIVDILKTIAGKDYTKHDTTAMLIADHFAKLINKIKGDVKIVYGVVEKGRPAKFDPATNTITISETYNGSETLDETINHEVTHYLLDHLIDNPKLLTTEQKNALNALRNQYKRIKTELNNRGQKFNIPNLKEFVAEIMSNKDFQKTVAELPFKETSVSAIAGASRIVKSIEEGEEVSMKREARPSFLTDLARSIARLLGFNRFYTAKELAETPYEERNMGYSLQDVIGTIQQMISPEHGYEAPSEGFRGKNVSYAPAKPRRKAPARPRTAEELIADSTKTVENDLPVKAKFAKDIWETITSPRKTYRNLVVKFQNASAPLKIKQRAMSLANQLKTNQSLRDANGNTEFNNTYQLQSTMFARADVLFNETMGEFHTKLIKQIKELKDLTKESFAETMGKLDTYLKAMHEPERRRLLFIKNLKLRDDIHIKVGNLQDTPANIKKYIFDALNTRVLTAAQAKNLRALLDKMIFNDPGDLNAILAKDRKGDLNMSVVDQTYYIGQNKEHLLDEEDTEYSPVNEMQPIEVDRMRGLMHADPHLAKIQEAFDTLKKIEEGTKELYKRANYWSPFATNYVEFYGFEHYVPFKGMPQMAMEKSDNLFYNDTDPLSKRYHEATRGMSGRRSKAANALIQIVVDAKKSGFAVVSNEVAESVANNIRQGHFSTTTKDKKPYKSIKFENRETELTKEEIAKQNTVFHYRPDGTIDIYTLKEKPILESLRVPYKVRNDFEEDAWNFLGGATRYVGQGFTLFNPAFAPWNFVRDLFTNILNINVEYGAVAMAKSLTNSVKMSTLDTLMGGGMFSCGKAMHLYQTNNIAKLKQLAQSGDPFYKTFYEMVENGAIVTYLQGVANKSEVIKVANEIGKGNLAKTRDGVVTAFQYWFNMFELTSKIGAMEPIKEAIKRQNPNMTAKEIAAKAAYEVKNLANFEQSGTLGKEMGSLYMFSRAQATGAVRAIDSLSYILPVEVAMQDLTAAERANPQIVAEFKKNYDVKATRARVLVGVLMGLGFVSYSMMFMGADDDELNDNKVAKDDAALWTRAMRFSLPGNDTNKVFQLPWGFGLGAITAWGAQLSILINGNQTYGEFLSNSIQIGLDSFVPLPVSRISFQDHPGKAIADTLTPTIARPFLEYLMNMNGLGRQIYDDNNLSNNPESFKGRGSTPEWLNDFCIHMFDISDGQVDLNPNTVSFLLSSYINGVNQFANTVDSISMLSTDEKEFDAKADSIVAGSFVGKLPDYEAREFIRVETEIKKLKKAMTGKTILSKDYEYMVNHPEVYDLIESYDNDVNGSLKELRAEANEIRNDRTYTKQNRDDLIKDNAYQQRILKKGLINQYKILDPDLKTRRDTNLD